MNYTTLALMASAVMLASCGKGDVSMKDASAEEVAKAVAEAHPIKAGKWDGTSEVVDFKLTGGDMGDAQGKAMVESIAKSMIGRKTTFSHCVTPEEAKKPGEKFFAGNDMAADCIYDSFTMAGGKVDAAMTCKDPKGARPGTMKMTMRGSYDESSYALETTMVAEGMGPDGKAGGMTISARNASRWVGDCDKAG